MNIDTKQRGELTTGLVHQKFGSARGFKSAAAKAIGVTQSNLANMMSGQLNTPQKYLEILAGLPDHEAAELIVPQPYQHNTQWIMTVGLSESIQNKLQQIANKMNGDTEVQLEFEICSVIIEDMISQNWQKLFGERLIDKAARRKLENTDPLS